MDTQSHTHYVGQRGVVLRKAKAAIARSRQAVSRRRYDSIQLGVLLLPNWANWMPLKSIWTSRTKLGDAKQIKLMALDDEDLKPLWKGESKIALLGSCSFQFFSRLAAVFAEEVGGFGARLRGPI